MRKGEGGDRVPHTVADNSAFKVRGEEPGGGCEWLGRVVFKTDSTDGRRVSSLLSLHLFSQTVPINPSSDAFFVSKAPEALRPYERKRGGLRRGGDCRKELVQVSAPLARGSWKHDMEEDVNSALKLDSHQVERGRRDRAQAMFNSFDYLFVYFFYFVYLRQVCQSINRSVSGQGVTLGHYWLKAQ